MRWEEFLEAAGNLPVVETELLLAGITDPGPIKVQISRWQKTGKLIQLKRGVYLLNKAYRRQPVNELYLVCLLKKPSYISLEKALEYHGLIPEAVRVYTAVTTKRPGRFTTPVGNFNYRHLKKTLFWGYKPYLIDKHTVFIAYPEKALLDLIYLDKIKVSLDYLEELRLQSIERFSSKRLIEFSQKFNKPAIFQAAKVITEYIKDFRRKEQRL